MTYLHEYQAEVTNQIQIKSVASELFEWLR